MSRSFTYLGMNLRINYYIRWEQTDEPLKQRQQLRLNIRQLLVSCGASGTWFIDIHRKLYPECRSKAQNVEFGAAHMKRDAGIRDGGKEIGWESTYTYGSERHFGILECRNALPTDYVKRPRRSVTTEANRVENAEWQCLAVAQIKAPSRCMDWYDRYG
jgi:hypothetical protein